MIAADPSVGDRAALARLLHDHRPESLLPPLLVSGCKCGWGSEVFAHSEHLADAILAALPSLAPAGETVTEACACGHDRTVQHDPEAGPYLCLVCGDNTRCDYADPEAIAADRWDEGWHAAVIALCPSRDEDGRLLWVLANMPADNPYRTGATR